MIIYNNRYGAPIRITAQDLIKFQADPKPSVKALTNRIANGVEQGTINSPDWYVLDYRKWIDDGREGIFGEDKTENIF